jgi:hypothetical protein
MRGLETLRGLWRQFSPLAPTFVIINDYEEEKQVERKATKKEEKVEWHVEVEQLETFSLVSIEGGFFDIKVDSLDTPIAVPIKFWSKYMMKCKGKKKVEVG